MIILAVVFGLGGGFAGALFIRAYVFNSAYDIPFFGEIDFSSGNYNGSNLIIRDARKVVVEQDTKVIETVNSARDSLVGIFKKIEVSTSTPEQADFNLSDYYKLNQAIGQGLVVTSDGWIITSAFIENANPERVLSDYAVITNNKRIYEIDKFIDDPITSFSFIHVKNVNNFSVKYFAGHDEVRGGQAVLAVDWRDKSHLTSVVGYRENAIFLKFSDDFSDELIFSEALSDDFKGAAVFNLAGDVVGLVNKEGKIRPSNQFKGAIQSLLKNQDVKRPSLGVNYIDLSALAPGNSGNANYEAGALIYKNTAGIDFVPGSAAQLAGLEAGDIIVALDNVKINQDNDLAYVLENYSAGDKVSLEYLRAGDSFTVQVELGENK